MKRGLGLWAIVSLTMALGGCEDAATGNSTLPPQAAGEAERCYERDELQQASRLAAPGLTRDVLILVDQTTEYPEDVRQSAVERVIALAAPGTRISVGTFSSYTETAHSRLVFETVVEPPFPQGLRNDAPMGALRNLDRCLEERRTAETERLRASFGEALTQSDSTIQRSDILANVRSFGRRLSGSPTNDRILLLVSDLLENSSTTSFYRNGAMKIIQPDAELASVERAELFGALDSTRVYVIGAGLIPPGIRSYRSLEELRSLERFWTEYFRRSNAASVEIGTPRLHSPIT